MKSLDKYLNVRVDIEDKYINLIKIIQMNIRKWRKNTLEYDDEQEEREYEWDTKTITYEDYLREFEPNSIELDEFGNYIGD
jgi:hypothetical protein